MRRKKNRKRRYRKEKWIGFISKEWVRYNSSKKNMQYILYFRIRIRIILTIRGSIQYSSDNHYNQDDNHSRSIQKKVQR